MIGSRRIAGATMTACLVAMGGAGTTVFSAGAAHAAANCPTADDIVKSIGGVTTQAGDLKKVANDLTPSSTAPQVNSSAQNMVSTINNLSTNLGLDTTDLSGCPALDAQDSQAVTTAFSTGGADLTGSLHSTIQKHSVLAQFGVTGPINASLRSLETAFDAYASALAAAVDPSVQVTIKGQVSQVDTALVNTTTIYDQICIPSPLYPTVLPVCASL
jgi:Hydrophobic surface binding protein A